MASSGSSCSRSSDCQETREDSSACAETLGESPAKRIKLDNPSVFGVPQIWKKGTAPIKPECVYLPLMRVIPIIPFSLDF